MSTGAVRSRDTSAEEHEQRHEERQGQPVGCGASPRVADTPRCLSPGHRPPGSAGNDHANQPFTAHQPGPKENATVAAGEPLRVGGRTAFEPQAQEPTQKDRHHRRHRQIDPDGERQ